MDVNKQNLYFVSNVCTADYLNRYYGIYHCSPFAATAVDTFLFLYFIDHYNEIDLSRYRIISNYKDSLPVLHGHTYALANKILGVNSEKTFALEFNYKNNDLTILFYYRHYELNNKSIEKINKRLYRFCNKTPFFVILFTPLLANIMSKKEKEMFICSFNNVKNDNKLFVCPGKDSMPTNIDSIPEKYCLFTSLMHEPLMPIIQKHLDLI